MLLSTRYFVFVILECLLQQVSHFCRCLFLHLVRGMGVGGEGKPGTAVPQHTGYSLNIDSVLQGQGCEGVPLRYNYDKPEMPRISKGFWNCQACFSSFSKPKNRAAK